MKFLFTSKLPYTNNKCVLGCNNKDDCLALTDWFCPDRLRHCYDNTCRCTFVPGGL